MAASDIIVIGVGPGSEILTFLTFGLESAEPPEAPAGTFSTPLSYAMRATNQMASRQINQTGLSS